MAHMDHPTRNTKRAHFTISGLLNEHQRTREETGRDYILIGAVYLFVPATLFPTLDTLSCGDTVEALCKGDTVVTLKKKEQVVSDHS